MRQIAMAGLPVSLVIASALDPSLVASMEVMAQACGMKVLGSISKPVTALALRRALHCNSAPRAVAPAFAQLSRWGKREGGQNTASAERCASAEPTSWRARGVSR
jgi:hypothetical protein